MAKSPKIRRIKRKKLKSTDLLGFQEETGYVEQEGNVFDEEQKSEYDNGVNLDSKNKIVTASGTTIQKKQNKENKTGLPDKVKNKMETAFHADFSEVKMVKDSPKPFKIGALAYAQGNEIHFSKGSFQPDTIKGQKIIGHELAHVVQQKEGKVLPAFKVNQVDINNDPKLEKEAQVQGENAANGTLNNKSQQKKTTKSVKPKPVAQRILPGQVEEEQGSDTSTGSGKGVSAYMPEKKVKGQGIAKRTWGKLKGAVTRDKSKPPKYDKPKTILPTTFEGDEEQGPRENVAPEQNPRELVPAPAKEAMKIHKDQMATMSGSYKEHGDKAAMLNKSSDLLGVVSAIAGTAANIALPGAGEFVKYGCALLNAAIKEAETYQMLQQIESITRILKYVKDAEGAERFLLEIEHIDFLAKRAQVKVMKSLLSPVIPGVVGAVEFVGSMALKKIKAQELGEARSHDLDIMEAYDKGRRQKENKEGVETTATKAMGLFSTERREEMEKKNEEQKFKKQGFLGIEEMREYET